MCSKNAHSHAYGTPRALVLSLFPRARCIKIDHPSPFGRSFLRYKIETPGIDPERPHEIAAGTTPMHAWWMAASMRL